MTRVILIGDRVDTELRDKLPDFFRSSGLPNMP
jgi:hypothetical protein